MRQECRPENSDPWQHSTRTTTDQGKEEPLQEKCSGRKYMGQTDTAVTAGFIEKKSSEFRGTSRCRELRKYDGLDALMDTAKGAAYDDAILVKDIMRGYLAGDFKIQDFMGLVEEGLDDGQMLLPEQRKAKAERICALLTRAASSEQREATFVKPGNVYAGGYEVTVCPDAMFAGLGWIELVLYRSGKPTVTQKGKKQDASVKNCLELYFLLKYARTMVPDGEYRTVKASYYFMRKTTDTSGCLSDMDFFSEKGGNVVTLEEEYLGGSTEETELDQEFLAQLAEFTEGMDGCQEDICRYCKMYMQCYWQKSPKKYEKKTLEGKKGTITPSAAQQAVIDFREGYCKVNAGAGTGKTECMTERGARMFAEGTDPSRMLFITFTEAGATEMKERLVKKTQSRSLTVKPEDIQAMTFNAFDFQIVTENYKELGFPQMPRVVDRVRSRVQITEILKEHPVSGLDYLNYTMKQGALIFMERAFAAIKEEHLDPSGAGAHEVLNEVLADAGYSAVSSSINIQDIFDRYREYDNALKKDCLAQFADQEPLANRFLDAHPSYLEERYGFEHIIVDEFQDSNDGQLDKIRRLCACKTFKSLMVVGDDSQAIYSFRHTSPENMIHFFEKMEVDGTELFLTENRRSREEIIALANGINDLNNEKVQKTMVSTRGFGGKVAVKGFFKKSDEYTHITNRILDLIDAGVKPERIAFIAFTREEITEMSAALAKEGIPWIMKNPLLMMDNSRVKAAISLGMAFYEPEATKGYFDYLVAKYDGEITEQLDAQQLEMEVYFLQSDFMALEDLPFEVQRAKFHEYLDAIRGEDEIYAHFLDLLYDNEDLQSELEYLLDFTRYGDREEKKMVQGYEGVVLTTAHSSKGLEWDYVFNSISKYDSERLHKNSRQAMARKEEMRRLMFVSMTRAREELFVSGQYICYGNKESGYTPNQFLEEVYTILDEPYDPVDHEAEKRRAEKASSKKKKAA